MNIKNFINLLVYVFILTLSFSCSSDDENNLPADTRSFTTNTNTDFFINKDGTVNIIVTGEFTDSGTTAEVTRRGFVYGTLTNPEVNDNNTEIALGPNPVNATFKNLERNQTIFIRGFFEMSDGTFFYGNEIKTSTDVSANNTRSISMTINQELFFKNHEGITPTLNVTALEKESPIEIGFEYSLNQDFSNSSIALETDATGNIFVTTYSEFITGLTSNTVYYFRPYAKYADNTVTNGGTSTASFTLNSLDNRAFTINSDIDYFINADGTVNLIVLGTFQDDVNFGNVTNRGFVFSTSSNPEVSTNNTSNVGGNNSAATGYIKNLASGQVYYLRGYFEMSDGSYFYGNEIQTSTTVDASTTRTITMEIESTPFFISQTEITPKLNLSNVTKEVPTEIGYEYSVNSDFSNSILKKIANYSGVHNQGVLVITSYSSELITELNTSTTYYFRPYAKYTDNTVTNGGASQVSFTTN